MKVVCLDLEWVLIPEIWEELWKLTKIDELLLTTRDISDYDELMGIRIAKMKEHSITLSKIKELVSSLDPLPWAQDFMKWLRENFQVCILTGSFYEYIMPLLLKLDYPFTYANNLVIENDMITGFKMRETDWKIEVINRLRAWWHKTIAIWDSYNDLKMIAWADKWIFFRPSEKLRKEMDGKFAITDRYEELKEILSSYIDGIII